MGLTAIHPARYGRLLARARPKVIESDEEFDRMAARVEELDFRKRPLTIEEEALRQLLAKLLEDYDERQHPLPKLRPRHMLRYLMEHRGLRQRDLIPVLGPSSVVSHLVNGKRSISKAQAIRLAEFFHVPAEVFI